MKPRRPALRLPPLVLLLLLAFVPSARGLEVVSVELKTGEKYDQVTYMMLPRLDVLELRSGDRIINVSYSDVEAIRDATGNNIAPRLLGTRYRPSAAGKAPPWGTTGVRSREPSPPTPLRVVLVVDGGMDVPLGDYYSGVRGGPGFGGAIHVPVSSEVALTASVSLLGLELGDSYDLVSRDPSILVTSQTHDLDGWRFLAGAEYHRSLGGHRAAWSFWYVHSSLGAIRHGVRQDARFRDTVTGQTYLAASNATDTRFAMSNGVGLVYGVWSHVGFAASGTIDMVWAKDYSSGTGTFLGFTGYVLGARVGLAYRL